MSEECATQIVAIAFAAADDYGAWRRIGSRICRRTDGLHMLTDVIDYFLFIYYRQLRCGADF